MSTKGLELTDEVMTKEARKIAVLRFLQDTELALPPKTIYINMVRAGATFSERTLKRHLPELEDDGLIRRLPDQAGPYYEITNSGEEYLADLEDDQA